VPLNPKGRGAHAGTNKKRVIGKISEEKYAWLDLPNFSVILFDGNTRENFDVESEREIEGLPPLKLAFRSPYRQGFGFDFSVLTEEEVEKLREIFNLACDVAKPFCKRLDEHAKEAFANGDDNFSRLYRPVPEVQVKKRQPAQHDESIWSRLEAATTVDDGTGLDEDEPGRGNESVPDGE